MESYIRKVFNDDFAFEGITFGIKFRKTPFIDLSNIHTIYISNKGALVLFEPYDFDLTYEAHIVSPSWAERGKPLLDFGSSVLLDFFTLTDAYAIIGRPPRSHRAARIYARALGFRPQRISIDHLGREVVDMWLTRNGLRHGSESTFKRFELHSEGNQASRCVA